MASRPLLAKRRHLNSKRRTLLRKQHLHQNLTTARALNFSVPSHYARDMAFGLHWRATDDFLCFYVLVT